MNGEKSFTIMVVSDHDSGLKKFRLTRRVMIGAVSAVAAVTMLAFGLGAHTIWQAVTHGTQRQQLKELAGKNQKLQGELDAVSVEINKLRETMDGSEQRLAKMALVVGVEDLPTTQTAVGLGGAAPGTGSRRMQDLQALQQKARMIDSSAGSLEKVYDEKFAALVSTPSIWPARGFVTSTFGNRFDPFTGGSAFHSGLDISAPTGTPVYAPANGTVTTAEYNNGLGQHVILHHGFALTSTYGHLHTIKVKPGQEVKRGQILGYVGSTGRSTGPHLHYEIQENGAAVDPRRFILNDITSF